MYSESNMLLFPPYTYQCEMMEKNEMKLKLKFKIAQNITKQHQER